MQVRQMGIESLAGFFEQTGQNMDAFREGLRDQAVLSAERNLVLSEIIRAEQLTVSDEEIEARVAEMTATPEDADEEAMAQNESMRALLTSGTGRSLVFNDILREKAFDRVQAIARGDELPELTPIAEAAHEDSADADVTAANETASEAAD